MITVGDFQSDWRKCNPIKKAQRSTGTANARGFSRGVGLRPTPKIPTAREKNLWYPGYNLYKSEGGGEVFLGLHGGGEGCCLTLQILTLDLISDQHL